MLTLLMLWRGGCLGQNADMLTQYKGIRGKLNLCLGTVCQQKYVPNNRSMYVFMLKEVFI